MEAGPDRKRTAEFRKAPVRQVLDGARNLPQVARSLQMSARTLANRVARTRRGRPLLQSPYSAAGRSRAGRSGAASASSPPTPGTGAPRRRTCWRATSPPRHRTQNGWRIWARPARGRLDVPIAEGWLRPARILELFSRTLGRRW